MIGGRLLARNSALNMVGLVVPLIAAIVAIPIIISTLGADRFGLLTLAWAATGYFSLFDFGMGRALTQAIGVRLGAGRTGEIAGLTWTSLLLLSGLGILGGLLFAALSPLLVGRVFRPPDDLRLEALHSFYILAPTIPLMLATVALRGVLEAYQDFAAATALRIPLGVANYLAPLAVVAFTDDLRAVMLVLLAARLVGLVLHLMVALHRHPELRSVRFAPRNALGETLRVGGWMTVSNVVSPLMVSIDRFLIGALISTAAVAYYATPYEAVTKLLLLPQVIMGVLFPAFAVTFARDRDATSLLVDRGLRVMLIMAFPLCAVTVAFAPEALRFWVGAEFAQQGSGIARWLTAGILVNCVAQVAFVALQGIGRPDVTARFHLLELPVYVLLLYALMQAMGVVGVAIAWTVRIALDTGLLFVALGRLLPGTRAGLRTAGWTLVLLVAALVPLAVAADPWLRLAIIAIQLAIFAALAWFRLLRRDERAALLQVVRRTPAESPAAL